MYTFEEIKAKIGDFQWNEAFDRVVAIANGGIIPAALINQRLGLPFELIKVSLRGPNQVPIHEAPRLMEPIGFDPRGERILLVEDRVKTGASLKFAKALLEGEGAVVRTFAVNGPADYSLYDEPCFKFPWIL